MQQHVAERRKSELGANTSPLNGQVLDYDDIDLTVEYENSIDMFSKEMARKIVLEAKTETCNNLTKRSMK